MEELVDQFFDEDILINDVYTPQSIAWKLLMDDIHDNFVNILMACNLDNNQRETDSVSFLFEILITIFMEMVFDLAIIINSSYKEFNPKIDSFNLDEILPTLKNKFKYVNIILNIDTYKRNNNDECLRELLDDRYCRVIFNNNHEHNHLFIKNNVSKELNYHMIINNLYKQKKELIYIYAIIMINDTIYKISFSINDNGIIK